MPLTFDQINRIRTRLERRHTPRIEAALASQGEALARAIEESRFPITDTIDPDVVREAVESLWTETILRFAEIAESEISSLKQVDNWQRIARDFIASDGGRMITNIGETTLGIVRVVLDKSFQEGWSAQETARQLREEWGPLSRMRAERIARTEVVRGSNHGSWESAKDTADQAGLTLNKVWLTAPVTGTERDRHALYDGLDGQVRQMHAPFDVGGYPAMYPGDATLPASEAIHCRCTLVYEEAKKSWIDRRDKEIKAAYPSLRDEVGQYAAMMDLGEQHGLAYDTIRKIVYS